MSSLASHSLHVAVELTGSGHHPAAEGAPGNLPIIGGDYWVDLTESDRALDLASFPTNVVRIRAADLREAQLERARIRAAVAEEGRDPDSVAVLVDLEILIAPEARSARKELAQLDSALTAPRVPVSLHYVGTPSGLGSLIADIRAAEVADGVTLLPSHCPAHSNIWWTAPFRGSRIADLSHRPPQSTKCSVVSDCRPVSARSRPDHRSHLRTGGTATVIRLHRPPVPEAPSTVP
ncbi:hypothetical protein GCM10020255_047580 [Rhodococcus baikonurensis]